MKNRNRFSRSQGMAMVVLGSLLAHTAGAQTAPSAQPDPKATRSTQATKPQQISRTESAPFRIEMDASGTLKLMDEAGNMMKPSEIAWPVKTTAVHSVNTMTVVHMEGSDFYVVNINGVTYQIHRQH